MTLIYYYNSSLTDWSVYRSEPCSVTCGNGTLLKSRDCLDAINGTVIPSKFCRGNSIEKDMCFEQDCPCNILILQDLSYMRQLWFFVDWSAYQNEPCSVTCGRGMFTSRRVCLQGSNAIVINETYCSGNNLKVEQCELTPCPGKAVGHKTTLWSELFFL